MTETAAAIRSCFLLSKECHLDPNLSAKLGFSLLSADAGCHRSSNIGSKKMVKKNANITPIADIRAKTFMGSRFEVARTETPAAVVSVVSKIARLTFS